MITKVKGLVIKTSNIKENDKYLTILTEDYGKMIVRASGVRSYKSKYMMATQLFAYSEFTVFQSAGFNKMNEVHLIEGFYNIRLDLKNLSLAAYFADIVSYITIENEDEGVLSLLLNTLHVLANKDIPLPIIKSVFEMRLLVTIGFMPNFEYCETCAEKIDLNKEYYFYIQGGNLFCTDCCNRQSVSIKESSVKIEPDMIKLIRFITDADSKKIFSFRIGNALIYKFSVISERYLLAHLAHKFDSLDYYKRMCTDEQ